jgi:hypothetical protein
MILDATTIHTRVADELSRIADSGVADLLRGKLVAPHAAFLPWDFGDDEPFAGIIVAELGEAAVGIAYCEEAFGASTPWLLVDLDKQAFRYDAFGFDTLELAFRAAQAESSS